MVYWIGYNKTGVGEVIRERGYDSLTKTRKVAAAVMKKEGYDWVRIYKGKTSRYHTEAMELYKGQPIVMRYNEKRGRFEDIGMNPDGSLGSYVRQSYLGRKASERR